MRTQYGGSIAHNFFSLFAVPQTHNKLNPTKIKYISRAKAMSEEPNYYCM